MKNHRTALLVSTLIATILITWHSAWENQSFEHVSIQALAGNDQVPVEGTCTVIYDGKEVQYPTSLNGQMTHLRIPSATHVITIKMQYGEDTQTKTFIRTTDSWIWDAYTFRVGYHHSALIDFWFERYTVASSQRL